VKINNNLKQYRKSAGLKQLQIAGKARISVRNYQRIESGKQEPKVSVAILIAQALHTTVEELFPLPASANAGEDKPDDSQENK